MGASSAAWPPASTTGEHRPQRDERSCPSRPRPAAAGASGWSRARSPAICSPTATLARGELERQPRVERLEQPARTRRRGVAGRAVGRAGAGEHRLQDERLVVAQPVAAPRCDLRLAVGQVDAAQARAGRQRAPRAHLGRQRVVDVVEDGRGRPHGLGDVPGRQLPRPGRPGSARRRRPRRAAPRVVAVEQLVVGVGELPARSGSCRPCRRTARLRPASSRSLHAAVGLEERQRHVVPVPSVDADRQHGRPGAAASAGSSAL